MPTRRQWLAATAATGVAAGVWAVEERVLPGRAALNRLLGLDGPDGVIPADAPGPTTSGHFDSAAMRGPVGWRISRPPGSTGPLPVALALHGRGGDHRSTFTDLGVDRFLAAHRGTPFAVATVDGGSSYWHPRHDTDPAAMITDELLPLLVTQGLDVTRLGLIGWSMGGYGALYLATRLRPACAVAVSPAVWAEYGQVTDGAFDDEADFAQHTIFAHLDKLVGIPLRVDCGDDDPFFENTELLRSRLPNPAGGFQPGAHRGEYWRRMLPAQLTFLGEHLR
ncbi:alpha/beta hydrolase [Actinokineospora sp. HUAS TT18]|uniref:alpha/beta hydrolase n=1 Tax=Actinokineospora sp. HUAS TT18 TaxID=3447451 RepID=UPI003F51E6D4